MRIRSIGFVVPVVLLVAPALAAQAVEDMPGYYPLEDLAVFEGGSVEVDIDLGRPMMQVVAAAAGEKEPEFAELASQVSRIRVRVGSTGSGDREVVSELLDRAIRELESDGWKPMIRVNEADELVRLYSIGTDDEIVGLTLLVNDGDADIVLANIVGSMDPRLIGKVLAKLDDFPDLEALGIDLGETGEDTD